MTKLFTGEFVETAMFLSISKFPFFFFSFVCVIHMDNTVSEYEILVCVSILSEKIWIILLYFFLIAQVPLPFVSLLCSRVHFYIQV